MARYERYKPGEIPAAMIDAAGVAAMLGFSSPSAIGGVVSKLRVAGVTPRGRNTGRLYWREDVERLVVERRGDAENWLTPPAAAAALGLTQRRFAIVSRAAGLAPEHRLRPDGGRRGPVYPRAAVERLAAERLASGAVAAEAAAARQKATLRAERAAARVSRGTLVYSEPVAKLPPVLYGLLDHHDAQALAARRARFPDWRPRAAA